MVVYEVIGCTLQDEIIPGLNLQACCKTLCLFDFGDSFALPIIEL